MGSAVFIQNQDLTLLNSEFDSNTAMTEGGALYLSCDKRFSYRCDFNIDNCDFVNNLAHHQGGALAFDLYPPIETVPNRF
jgi:hypothetical protein